MSAVPAYPSASLLLSPLGGSTTIWEMKGGGNYFPETCYAAHDFKLQWFARRPKLLVLLPTRPLSPGTPLGKPSSYQLWPFGKPACRRNHQGLLRLLLPRAPPGSGSGGGGGGGGRSGRRERFRRPPSGSPLASVRSWPAELLVGTGWWGARGRSPRSPAASRDPAPRARRSSPARVRTIGSLAPASHAPRRPLLPPLESFGRSVSGGIRRREAPRPLRLVPKDRPGSRRGLSGQPAARREMVGWAPAGPRRRRPEPGLGTPPPAPTERSPASSSPHPWGKRRLCSRVLRPTARLLAPSWPDPAALHPSGRRSRSPVCLHNLLPFFLRFPILPGLIGSLGWALRRGKRLGSPRRRLSPPPPCGGGRGSRLGGHRSGWGIHHGEAPEPLPPRPPGRRCLLPLGAAAASPPAVAPPSPDRITVRERWARRRRLLTTSKHLTDLDYFPPTPPFFLGTSPDPLGDLGACNPGELSAFCSGENIWFP